MGFSQHRNRVSRVQLLRWGSVAIVMGIVFAVGAIVTAHIQASIETCTGTSCTLTGPVLDQPVLFAVSAIGALGVSSTIVYVRDGRLGGDGGDRDGD